MDTLVFRWTTEGDLGGILEIEELSFPSPWSVPTFLSVIQDRDCYNLTAFCNGKIVGYCFAQSMRRMVHLLNLAVHPDFRREGIGRALLSEIISFARSRNKSYVFLEVRKSNDIAKELYTSMGFTHACTWRRYYSDIGEDASIMVKRTKE